LFTFEEPITIGEWSPTTICISLFLAEVPIYRGYFLLPCAADLDTFFLVLPISSEDFFFLSFLVSSEFITVEVFDGEFYNSLELGT
jgi:hypothetical protein